MRSFFESMTPWRHNDGSLHVYFLPDEETADGLVELQSRIAGIDNLPLMPAPWLHFTVSRLPQFDDLGNAALTRLSDALTAELEGMSSFEIDVAAPVVHELAVECVATPTPEWEALVDAVRRGAAVEGAGADEADFPVRPYAPHVSLAYATGAVDSAEVEGRLSDAPALGQIRVNQVHLVSVTVRPELGTFDWVELANWSLP